VSQQKSKKTLINWDLVSVNPNNKNWDWKDLFYFWGVNIQSIIGFSLIASLYIIYDMNSMVVFFGTVLGSFLVYLFSNWIGKPSQKFGLPFVVLLRSSLGFNGAKIFGLLRCITGIFMFGVQTYFLSKAIVYLIRIGIFSFNPEILNKEIFLMFFLGLNIIDWFSLLITIIAQGFLFSAGMIFNRKLIKFSAITVYLGMIVFFFSTLLIDVKSSSYAFINSLNYLNFFDKNNIAPLITVTGTMFTFFSIVIMNFGDFSRYVKNENELKKGNLSLIANLIIFSFFSVFIVIGSDVFLNLRFLDLSSILTNPTDIIGKFDNTSITVIAIFFILISSASTNLVANFIPSQYSLVNFLPNSLNLKSASYVISIVGFFVSISSDLELRSFTFWTMGGLDNSDWFIVILVSFFTILPFLFIYKFKTEIDIFMLGDSEAANLGVNVEYLKRKIILISSIMVGISVAFCGMIGFVGLVTPHLIRLFISPNHKYLIPGSALLGSLILVLSDFISKTIISPAQLPIGIVTSAIGAPFFVWLILSQKRRFSYSE